MQTPSPEFPPQKYTGRYEPGFRTDRQLIEPSEHVWGFLFRGVENFILCNPYIKSHEVEGWGGVRLLLTEDAGFLDCPSLVVYFKVDEESHRVAFLAVHRESDALGGAVAPEDPPPGLL